MRWNDVVAAYPNQWLVVEAIEAHTEVIESRARGSSADRARDAIPSVIDALDDDEPSDGVIADSIARDATVVADRARGWTYRRVLDRVSVLELCADGRAAMHASREHARCANREVLCVHTSYPSLHFEHRVVPRRRRGPSERPRATR